ncbi:hypothetical protein K402DRAFT_462390 [Aulographum hederae CBS 113979]|uniref:Fe2OG dioxygenase domain-containing protein n=1 Tax=Aulographum hederae CBS 113979 TaxID=1176131 RepID=A0A6G1H4Y3_9PEZI|nr:hypothetical protein K402DRAFT_462390 [Aulographum hederae CBS 113979]
MSNDPTNSETHNEIIHQLRLCILEQKAIATFACGGNIPIAGSSDSSEFGDATSRSSATVSSRDKVSTEPVAIRWDSPNPGKPIGKAIFPLSTGDAGLLQLVSACTPATFGRGNEDILDETYRKAGKLDTTAFSTNFCPYACGIIDSVAQFLLPSIGIAPLWRGLRAEIYKLNVYSSPAGRFKPHMDTPRSEKQIGSLVVCLPCIHKGGALQVRHKGANQTFDWSSDKSEAPDIKWAAFYSDCEHEVEEVVSGHRITLTYNLFVERGPGLQAGHSGALDAKQLPLYQIISQMLHQQDFMPKGGRLGIACSHKYAHTHQQSIEVLPSALKGVDMAVFEAFQAHELDVSLLPVVGGGIFEIWRNDLNSDWEDEPERSHQGDDSENLPNTMRLKRLEKCLLRFDPQSDYETFADIVEDLGPVKEHVEWVVKARAEEVAMAYAAYGNNVSLEAVYTSLALFVDVPAFVERQLSA